MKKLICTACGHSDKERKFKKTAPGKASHGLGLTLISFPLALIHSIFRKSQEKRTCPKCGGQNLIPTDSPMGQKFLREVEAENEISRKKAEQNATQKRENSSNILKYIGKFIAALFLFIGVGSFFAYDFPYNLIQLLIIVSAVIALFPSFIGKLFRESYEWKFFKVSRKMILVFIGVLAFIFWVIFMNTINPTSREEKSVINEILEN